MVDDEPHELALELPDLSFRAEMEGSKDDFFFAVRKGFEDNVLGPEEEILLFEVSYPFAGLLLLFRALFVLLLQPGLIELFERINILLEFHLQLCLDGIVDV